MGSWSRSEPRLWGLLGLACLLMGGAVEPFVFVSLEGEPVTLALAEHDRVLVVHFWATWCPPCVEELGLLEEILASCPADHVRIVAVNVGEDTDEISAFLREHGFTLPVLRDPRGRVWRKVSGMGLPVNLVWTPEGRRTEVGPRDRTQWLEMLDSAGCRK